MKRLAVFLAVVFFFSGCTYTWLHSPLGILGAGSYPHVEIYKLDTEKQHAIRLVDDFKKQHAEHAPPPWVNEKGEVTIYQDHHDRSWYFFCLYDPEESMLYYSFLSDATWKKEGSTELAFNGIQPYDRETRRRGAFRRINMELEFGENMHRLKRFKKLFVEPLRKKLKKRP